MIKVATVYWDVSKQSTGMRLSCRSVKNQDFLCTISKNVFIFMYIFYDFVLFCREKVCILYGVQLFFKIQYY